MSGFSVSIEVSSFVIDPGVEIVIVRGVKTFRRQSFRGQRPLFRQDPRPFSWRHMFDLQGPVMPWGHPWLPERSARTLVECSAVEEKRGKRV